MADFEEFREISAVFGEILAAFLDNLADSDRMWKNSDWFWRNFWQSFKWFGRFSRLILTDFGETVANVDGNRRNFGRYLRN